MTEPGGRRGARGRPRDASRDQALLDATRALLTERGYAALTTAAVAARAGVSTATLYRRWRSKEDLVVDAALGYAQDLASEADTGTLPGDLRALLRDKAATLTGPGGRLLRTLVGEAAHNNTLAHALSTAFTQPVRDRVAQVVRRAVKRGEIPPVDGPDLVGDLVIGPMVSRFLLVPLAPEDADRDHASDRALDPNPAQAAEAADRLLPFLLRALGAGTPPAHGG